jgi:hypothetical protein
VAEHPVVNELDLAWFESEIDRRPAIFETWSMGLIAASPSRSIGSPRSV